MRSRRRYQSRAQASWMRAAVVCRLLVIADQNRAHFCSQASVSSTTQRRAGWVRLPARSSFLRRCGGCAGCSPSRSLAEPLRGSYAPVLRMICCFWRLRGVCGRPLGRGLPAGGLSAAPVSLLLLVPDLGELAAHGLLRPPATAVAAVVRERQVGEMTAGEQDRTGAHARRRTPSALPLEHERNFGSVGREHPRIAALALRAGHVAGIVRRLSGHVETAVDDGQRRWAPRPVAGCRLEVAVIPGNSCAYSSDRCSASTITCSVNCRAVKTPDSMQQAVSEDGAPLREPIADPVGYPALLLFGRDQHETALSLFFLFHRG